MLVVVCARSVRVRSESSDPIRANRSVRSDPCGPIRAMRPICGEGGGGGGIGGGGCGGGGGGTAVVRRDRTAAAEAAAARRRGAAAGGRRARWRRRWRRRRRQRRRRRRPGRLKIFARPGRGSRPTPRLSPRRPLKWEARPRGSGDVGGCSGGWVQEGVVWAHARQIHTHDAGVTPRAGAGWCQRAMARARAVVRAGRRSQEREGPAAATSLGGRWPKSTAAPAKGCLPRRRWWMRGECGRWRSRFDCRSKAGCVRAGCPCAPHLSLPRKSSLSEKISQSARRGGRSPSCATSRMEATAAKGAAETAAAAEVAAKEVAAARMAVRVDAASKPNSFFSLRLPFPEEIDLFRK